jgi:putative phosphonate catabolism associated alcohol dehydrogenase
MLYIIKVSNFASFINSKEKFIIDSQDLPELNDGEVLVKNLCTSICRSDIHTYQGKRIEKSPTILGHEIVGIIEKLGPNSPLIDLRGTKLKVGDKVTWAIYASSPDDDFSKAAIPQKAKDLFKYGHEQITESSHFHGGLSEHTILRKNTPIIVLKDELPSEIASLINCSVATVAGSVRLAGDIKNKSVAVYGTGMLGIIACAMVSKMGASKVLAIDENKERLETALQFGATETAIPTDLLNHKVDIVIEFSGSLIAMQNSIKLLKIGGTTIWIGAVFPQPPVELNAEYMIRNIITIKGLHNYNNEDFISAVNFMEMNYSFFNFDKLVKKGFSLDKVTEAFEYAVTHNPFRVSIDFSDAK